MINDAMMLCDSSHPGRGIGSMWFGSKTHQRATNNEDNDDDEIMENDDRPSTALRSLALPSMTSNYSPKEMEGALRIMTHAGRILWKAAMASIPGQVGSYNPSLKVLSKLFSKSFGKKTSQQILPVANNNNNHQNYEDTEMMPDDDDDVSNNTTYYGSDDSMETTIEIEEYDDNNYNIPSTKRKIFSGIQSFLPSAIVSDSETESDDDYEQTRPSKRMRRLWKWNYCYSIPISYNRLPQNKNLSIYLHDI